MTLYLQCVVGVREVVAKMSDEGRVHPDCRNASNPYHECTEYCFKVIAEVKAQNQQNEPGLFDMLQFLCNYLENCGFCLDLLISSTLLAIGSINCLIIIDSPLHPLILDDAICYLSFISYFFLVNCDHSSHIIRRCSSWSK